jgi:hypothetical protein
LERDSQQGQNKIVKVPAVSRHLGGQNKHFGQDILDNLEKAVKAAGEVERCVFAMLDEAGNALHEGGFCAKCCKPKVDERRSGEFAPK